MLTIHGNTDTTGQRSLNALLADQVCRSAVHLESAASTNALALIDCQKGIAADLLPRIYLADQQTSGRGRHGRRWYSSQRSITLSLVIAGAAPKSPLPIAVGVGVARSIEYTYAPLRTALKWPNDVYIDGGKVAGILMETNHASPDRVVIGIGINIGETPDPNDLGDDAAPPRSIAQAIGRPIPRYEILSTLVTQLISTITELAEPNVILDEFRQRCLLSGKSIRFSGPNGTQSGACLGINEAGELAVRVGATIHHCRTGEAHHLRPQSNCIR